MDLTNHTVHALQEACKTETARYRSGDPFEPRYCEELFRRAVVERDEQSWAALFEQYEGQVTSWVRAEVGRNDTQRIAILVNAAFTRFWQAVTPSKFNAQLNQLGKLLQYLKMCAQSAFYDEQRKLQRRQHEVAIEQMSRPIQSQSPLVEWAVSQKLSDEQLWEWVWTQLKTEDERLIIELSFQYGLTAAQIHATYPDRFDTVRRIYRTQENVLRRLRRRVESEHPLSSP